LCGEGWPEGYGRLVLDEVDSTNLEAMRRAEGLPGPTWILARRQTAAHGRRGRAWAMAAGNFAATLALRPEGPPEQAALRSFVAALALHDALAALGVPAEALTLKWPNDVLLNGGKVAGILLESAGAGRAVRTLVVGIGVNLVQAPAPSEVEPQASRPVSVRDESGLDIAPEALLDALAPAFAAREDSLRTYGFAPIRTAWLARAGRIGEEVVARTGSATHRGTFETLDDTGALVLRTAAGRQAVAAAEIFF
jgi:BirA family transcriptional regulator, biotin operon repressor / biotin---[acetyl-CoA-carboxylase] ligase